MRAVNVDMFQSDDGKLFDNVIACRSHEASIKTRTLVEEIGIGSGGEWSGSMIAKALFDNRFSFIEALGGVPL